MREGVKMKGDLPFWQKMTDEDVLKAYKTDMSAGLSENEAVRRQKKYGKNSLWKIERTAIKDGFLNNFFDISGVLLITAAILSVIFSDKTAGALSIIFVLFSWVLRFLSYLFYRYTYVSIAMSALPRVKIKRDGRIRICPADKIVVGDIVYLESGDIVPADIRLISSDELAVSENNVTGNKELQKKTAAKASKGSFENIVFASSMVISGSAAGVVVESGRQTLVYRKNGCISIKMNILPQSIKEADTLSRKINIFLLIFAFAAFPLSLLTGADMLDSFFLIMTMCFCTLGEFYSVFAHFIYCKCVNEIKNQSGKSCDVMRVDILDRMSKVDTVVFSDMSFFRTGKLNIISEYVSGITLKADRIASLRLKVPVEESISKLSDLMFSVLYMTSGKTPFSVSFSGGAFAENDELIEDCYAAYKHLTIKKDEDLFSGRTLVEYSSLSRENNFLGTVMYTENGKYYTALSGSVENVLGRCRRFYTSDGTLPLTADAKNMVYSAYRQAVHNGFYSVAVAVKESPYNSLIRMSVQQSEMTFVGFVTVNRPVSRNFAGMCDILRRNSIKLAVFSDSSESEKYFVKNNGILGSKDLYINENESIVSETAGGTNDFVVVSEHSGIKSASRREALFSALKKAGRNILFAGNSSKDGPYLKKADVSAVSSAKGEIYMQQGIRNLSDISVKASKDGLSTAEVLFSAMKISFNSKICFRKVFTYLLISSVGKILFMLLSLITGIYLLTPVYIIYSVTIDMFLCGFMCVGRKKSDNFRISNKESVESNNVFSFVCRIWKLFIFGGAGGGFAYVLHTLVLKFISDIDLLGHVSAAAAMAVISAASLAAVSFYEKKLIRS